jgi:diguanylate cyclase
VRHRREASPWPPHELSPDVEPESELYVRLDVAVLKEEVGMESSPDPPDKPAPLSQLLGQSERVQDKVEQAATDLSSVNAVLKDEIAEGVPLAKVERALNQSEAIEVRVQEAAEELVAVNDALALEIDERHRLEDQLSESTAALSASRAQERRSRHTSLHDAVTGLPNLTLFNNRLDHGIAQAQRHGWRLAVMFIDLDDFKRVNDVHGHKLGDDVLCMIAQRLQAAVRTGDTVSRRSGDEFLLLMLEAKEESSVAAFAARIMQNIAETCEIRGVTLTVKASIGIALYPDDGRSAQELLMNADAAMYTAKQHKDGPMFYRSAGG